MKKFIGECLCPCHYKDSLFGKTPEAVRVGFARLFQQLFKLLRRDRLLLLD